MFTVLKGRNFALLWFGGVLSFAGDWLLLIALPVYVYDLTGSTLLTSGLFIAQSLPRLVFGSVAGVFVDRWDRRRTMIAADLGRGAVLLLLLLVRSAGWLWLIYFVTFVQTLLSLFFQPAERALVPQIVGEEQLIPANGLNSLTWEMLRVVAPPVGGVLMAVSGIGSIVVLDSLSFLASALLLRLIVLSPGPRSAATTVADGVGLVTGLRHELAAGLRLVRHDRRITVIFVITGVVWIAEGSSGVLGFPWVKQVLGGGALERGYLVSAQGVGGVLGGLLIGRVARHVPPVPLISSSGMVFGLTMLVQINVRALPLGTSLLPAVLALKVVAGIAIVGFIVSIDTLLQQSVADRFRGRVFGAYDAWLALLMLGGQLLAGELGDRLGIVPVLNGTLSLHILAGLLALALLPTALRRHAATTETVPAAETAAGS